jgi:hypothetical protein
VYLYADAMCREIELFEKQCSDQFEVIDALFIGITAVYMVIHVASYLSWFMCNKITTFHLESVPNETSPHMLIFKSGG